MRRGIENLFENESGNKFFLVGLGIVFTLIYLFIFDKKIAPLEDNLTYFILGKALASGEGYTNVHLWSPSPANHFPPGYPILLSFFFKIFGSKILLAKVLNGIFLFGTICNFYLFFKRFASNKTLAALSTIILALNPTTLEYSVIVMSEIPFLFLSSIALVFLSKIKFREEGWKDKNLWIMAFVVGFSLLTRTQGIAMVGGILFYFLFKKAWQYASIYISVVALLYLPWYLRSKSLGGSTYINQLLLRNPLKPDLGYMEFGDWPIRFFLNLERYILTEIPNGIFGFLESGYKVKPGFDSWLFGLGFIGLILFGLSRLRKIKILISVYILATFSILLLWCEVWEGTRFLVPLIPLLIFLMVEGIAGLLMHIPKYFKLPFKIKEIWIILIVFSLFPGILRLNGYAKMIYGNDLQEYLDLGVWAKKNLPDTAIVACRKPSLFYVYADRRVSIYPFTNNDSVFLSDLNRKSVDFVVLDNLGLSSTAYLHRMAKKYPEKLFPVKKMEKTPTFLLQFDDRFGYEGEWKDEMREGKGRVKLPNGGFYDGDWKKGKMDGIGVFLWPDGRKYEGNWKDNRMDGLGKMYDPDGKLEYDGMWKDGKPNSTYQESKK